MTDRRLTEALPVRVSRKQKIALRRWARQTKVDVSDIVRDMIDERLRRESGDGAMQVGVAA